MTFDRVSAQAYTAYNLVTRRWSIQLTFWYRSRGALSSAIELHWWPNKVNGA